MHLIRRLAVPPGQLLFDFRNIGPTSERDGHRRIPYGIRGCCVRGCFALGLQALGRTEVRGIWDFICERPVHRLWPLT